MSYSTHRILSQEQADRLVNSNIISYVDFPSGLDCRIIGTDIYFIIYYQSRRFSGFFNDIDNKDFENFEEALDSLEPTMQTELLFHLDLFGDL